MPETPRDGSFIFFSPFFMPQEIPKNRHASEAAMKKLPIIKITQEHIDAQATCPICLDAFSFANNIDETNDPNISTNIDTNEKMNIEDTQYVDKTTNNNDKKEDGNNKVDQATQTHEVVREMPCKHMFCESCLFKWLKQNVTCPLCRIEIESGDEQQKIPQTPPVSSSPLQTPISSSSPPSFSPSEHEQSNPSNPSNTSITSSAQNAIIDEDHQEHQVNEQQQISSMITMPQCQHHFHPNCLRTSLLVEGYSFDEDSSSNDNNNSMIHFRCPSCRTPATVQRDLLKIVS
ncbi:7654_t:CDS:2 [Diversispora eburnea]|uniref:E3 ubiquitin-protein ligase RNF181 n=1 Tax=Diversispora eburnea TaxID=1213867 RepID=A0A9N9FSX7_9GLOM|nr:7654_t:CDS:2 [Diversispora eburnea]